MADDRDVMADFWALEEAECARRAVENMRMETLANSMDALVDRITDCERLIADGKVDYEHAFKTMIKPQVDRIVEAKNRVLDVGSLPSVIASLRSLKQTQIPDRPPDTLRGDPAR